MHRSMEAFQGAVEQWVINRTLLACPSPTGCSQVSQFCLHGTPWRVLCYSSHSAAHWGFFDFTYMIFTWCPANFLFVCNSFQNLNQVFLMYKTSENSLLAPTHSISLLGDYTGWFGCAHFSLFLIVTTIVTTYEQLLHEFFAWICCIYL